MELFTVDYALNYEGWTYDTEVAPYNVYNLDQFTIRVRRNDFFLLLYITNACDELVFAGRIYTIEEYKTKIKKKLHKWKCKVHSTAQPTPSNNLEIVPKVINLTYIVGQTITNETVSYVFNETVTQLTTSTLPGLSILIVSSISSQEVAINGSPTTEGVYTSTISFMGEDSGTVIQVVFNVTVLPITGAFILLESGDYILLENSDKILIEY